MIRRRTFTAGVAAALAAPRISKGAGAAPLKFIPQSDLTILDPIVTTVYTARNHGYMVFDTLFGMDSNFQMQPQMLDRVSIEDDGKRWVLRLREGLLWHDGERVTAKDCVASVKRWAARDGVGSLLMARTDELSVIDDRTFQFRLKRPFAHLPYAFGKISTPMCAIMPERFASMDPFKAVPEMVGSGPFKFKADEWISGARAVYVKNDRYVPRNEPNTGWTAGGKVVHFERVEWLTSPDDGTSAASMRAGEMDWWELPTVDLLPVLKQTGRIKIQIKDKNGTLGLLKPNALQPPFNNPEIRRAFLGALGVAGIGYVATQLPKSTFQRSAPPPPKPKPSEHNATFDFARVADLASWQALDLAPRHEPGRGLSLAGPLLYSALPRVSAGSLDLSLYLESGSADLLLGYDRQTRDHSCVRLIVEPGAVRLLALDVQAGTEVPRAQPLILTRDGHSRHDLSIRFDSRSILARWGDAQTYWENLSLRPGSVGISADAADQALLLAARLALRV